MNHETQAVPLARVFYRSDEPQHQGWYVQHYVRDKLQTIRLEIRRDAESLEVTTEAAGFVGCIPAQIQIEGTPWPLVQLHM